MKREDYIPRFFENNNALNSLCKKYTNNSLYKKYEESKLSDEEYIEFIRQISTAIPINSDTPIKYTIFREEAEKIFKEIDKKVDDATKYAANLFKGVNSLEEMKDMLTKSGFANIEHLNKFDS